jgi:hypothetical protein
MHELTNIYLGSVRGVLRAIDIRSPSSYRWLGTLRSAGRSSQRLAVDDLQTQLAADLQWNLYRSFYTTGGVIVPLTDTKDSARGSSSLMTALSEANEGVGHWQGGWLAAGSVDGGTVAVRAGLRVLADASELRQGSEISDGLSTPLQVKVPKELRNATPGFYLAVGDAGSGAGAGVPLLRWYWNATPLGAVDLMRLTTSRLNAAGIPFQLKALSDPTDYDRSDSVVLYTPVDQYATLAPIVASIHARVAERLAQRTPAFVKPLARGLGIAEDPGNGESFGAHRCRLLAEGVVAAQRDAGPAEEERLEAVIHHMDDSDVELRRPYLSKSAGDVYVAFVATSRLPRAFTVATPMAGGRDGALSHATAIGHRLIDTAVWHAGVCTWFGPRRVANPIGGRRATGWGVIGPTLYSGTSGIALFLAELAVTTGMPLAAETAVAAVRNGLARAESIDPSARLGLYSGCSGIAYAAARAGVLLGDDELVREGEALILRCAETAMPEGEFDVISGKAGGILACLATHALTGRRALPNVASALGESLLQEAVAVATGAAWRPPREGRRRPLTGLAHGASGPALALTELYASTGDVRYRAGADAAFDYERAWFDPVAGNWPDFRWGAGSARHRIFGTSWCHGAPGMALARARAWAVSADPRYRAEADLALETTAAVVAAALDEHASNWSLCHGVVGNIEILALAAKALGQAGEIHLGVAEAASERLCRDRGPEWPTHEGEASLDPGLMLGLAGAGMFFLRRAHDSVAPVLRLGTESSARLARGPMATDLYRQR